MTKLHPMKWEYGPMDAVEQQIGDVVRSLQTDRLINITVGAGTESGGFTVQLQQKALESTSEWFTAALKRNTFIEGEAGKISFPEDDCKAWEVLIYWIMKHEFPLQYIAPIPYLLATKCWALGDKYDIKAFQDEAMKALINYTETDVGLVDQTPEDLAQILAACPPESKLARLITEQIAHEYTNYAGGKAWALVSALPIGDLWKDLSRAQMVMAQEGEWYFLSRLGEDGKRKPGEAFWTDYMVGPPGDI